MTLLLEGRAIAATLRAELRPEVAAFAQHRGRPPGLAALDVGGDPAAASYLRAINRACVSVGITFQHVQADAALTQADLLAQIGALSADSAIDGVILQMPLPAHLVAADAIEALDPRKDVDGLHPLNAGRLQQGLRSLIPNTPAGGMELLRRYGIAIAGKSAVVVGRSNVVGKPMALLLLQEQATVTICHSRTPDLAAVIGQADIVAVAVGRAGLVTGAMLKVGTIVVDFGINVGPDGALRGDVDFESAAAVAGAITPVPGGTGPVTNLMLLRNTLQAARDLAGIPG
jgi:methylenetetrahydrofolate dehydrogenase (NADP+)/methenyltetrahydrofolate cyclohydrolase